MGDDGHNPAPAGEGQAFSLDAPQAGLSAAAFGRLRELQELLKKPGGVTDVAVCKWIGKGMPAIRGADKAWLIDKAVGLEWVRVNVGERWHGGERKGSGRKARRKQVQGTETPRGPEETGDAQQELALEKAQENAESDEAVTFLDRVPPSHPDFVREAFRSKLPKATIERMIKLVEMQQKTTELSIRTRGMVSETAAAERMAGKVVKARAIVQAAPLTLAEAVVSAARLDPGVVPILAAEIRKVLALMMRHLSGIDGDDAADGDGTGAGAAA